MHQVGEATMEAAAIHELGPLSSALFQADDRGPYFFHRLLRCLRYNSLAVLLSRAALDVQLIAWIAM